jgi:hypothetical protein
MLEVVPRSPAFTGREAPESREQSDRSLDDFRASGADLEKLGVDQGKSEIIYPDSNMGGDCALRSNSSVVGRLHHA